MTRPYDPLFATPLIAALLCAAPVAAQWTPESPLPTYLDVRGVGAPTAQSVFIATDDNSFDSSGALWESADGGLTWIQRDVPTSLGDPLNGLFFLDSLNGWAFGNANFRTTDGGATWTAMPFLGSTYFMEFFSPTFGVGGDNTTAHTSTDGGVSWNPSPNGMFEFSFADNLTGLGVSDTGVYRTTDGGVTFSLVLAGEADAVAHLSATTITAIVDSSFARSTDGGVTWATGVSADGRNELTAVSATDVLAWGRSGTFPTFDDRLFHSGDGGVTWTDVGTVMPTGVLALTVSAAPVITGTDYAGHMYRSTDSGQTWTQTFTNPLTYGPGFLSSAVPVFTDPLTGYYGFGPGFVVKTTDGGATWAQISSGSGQNLNGLDQFPDGSLIAVGENGTVVRSAGAGAPWLIQPTLGAAHLMAVDVLNATDVVIVEQGGTVHRSSDAGATWTAGATAPTGLGAEDLDFQTLLDGWVIGSGFSGAALFHTTDGGDTWTGVPDFQGGYTSVDVEGSNIWASNVSGTFYRSIDDGATWTQGQLPGSPLSIEDMDFFDVSTGYAVGRWGFAARTSDAGLTWQTLPTPNSTDMLTDLHLTGPNELWASTNNGVAYYSANAGQGWAILNPASQGFGTFAGVLATPAGDAWMAGGQGAIEKFTGPPPPPLNRPPAASFDYNTNGLTVTLTDTSTDPDGFITSWLWDFGDGATSTSQHTSHTFASANTYIVTLTVTDDDADTGSTVRFIVAQPGPGGTFGIFTEVTPLDSLFVTPQTDDFWVSTTAPADYDLDGDLDVAVLGYYVVYNTSVDERLVLFRNDGEVSSTEWEFAYIDVPLGTISSGASNIAWGDVDGDGDQDLALGSDGQTVIYRNDAGTLVMTDTVLPPYLEDNLQADFDLNSISWADYDNDGDEDLLLPSVYDDSTFTYRTALMRNDGANGTGGWTFAEAGSTFAFTEHAQSSWADFDGDQDLDLLLVHLAPLTNNGFIRRYRNDGGGAFFGEDILGTLSIEHGEAHWGDYDEDGDYDILVAGNIKETNGSYTKALRIYRNDAETFVLVDIIPCVSCDGWFDLTAATWADYDSDGDVDILLAGSYNSGSQIEGRARIYENIAGTFVDSGTDLPAPRAGGTRGGSFSWLDLDGEGDLDYFIAGEYYVPGGNGLIEAQMHAYRNDVLGTNAAPAMPSGLSANVSGSDVVLAWNPASDDHTPATALTYDLQVFQGGVPVANPWRLPQPGNVTAGAQWALAGLPTGSYTWTVRTVDSAYHGSAAAQGAFGVGVTVDAPGPNLLPREFSLAQGFPNPFSTSTTFRLALPQRSPVDLAVYDVTGRLVERLASGELAAGFHEVRWDARDASSGVYFVRLRAGAFKNTRRVLLLK